MRSNPGISSQRYPPGTSTANSNAVDPMLQHSPTPSDFSGLEPFDTANSPYGQHAVHEGELPPNMIGAYGLSEHGDGHDDFRKEMAEIENERRARQCTIFSCVKRG